jgi:hypothetical protein
VLDDSYQVQNPRLMTDDYFELVLEKYEALADQKPVREDGSRDIPTYCIRSHCGVISARIHLTQNYILQLYYYCNKGSLFTPAATTALLTWFAFAVYSC